MSTINWCNVLRCLRKMWIRSTEATLFLQCVVLKCVRSTEGSKSKDFTSEALTLSQLYWLSLTQWTDLVIYRSNATKIFCCIFIFEEWKAHFSAFWCAAKTEQTVRTEDPHFVSEKEEIIWFCTFLINDFSIFKETNRAHISAVNKP